VIFKMNAAELSALVHESGPLCATGVLRAATDLAGSNKRPVFITRAEHGIIAAAPDEAAIEVPALPVRGAIDVVGAGDCVTANLTTALCAGADLREAMELAMLASSLVVHQVGTTGTASVAEIRALRSMAAP
jgi:bifunctional ADP-heptose synthase (sugar kinase/adenylyltransferase)